MDGATSRRRGSRASTAISAGEAPDAEVHFITSIADNYFGVVGPTPIELINNDYRSIYTWPQTTKNQAQLLAMNGRYSDELTIGRSRAISIYRKFQQAHVDGNAAEVERCSGRQPIRCSIRCAWRTTGFPRQPRGELPDPQRRTIGLINCPPGTGQHLRHYTLGHGRPHLDQCAHHRRLVAGHQRRQDIRPRQLFHHRRQRRPQQDRFPGQQRARLHLSRISSSAPTLPCRGPDRSSTPPATSASARSASLPGIPITASTSTRPSISPIGCR